MSLILSIFTRFPPWASTALLALTMAIGFTLPDYSAVFDHAPTAFVCVDTSKKVLVENAIPISIVLARNRPTVSELVDNPFLSSTASATDRERASESGASNPLKRRLC